MGGSRGGGDRGSGPPAPGIARLLIFAMLKISVRPLLGIWTPPPPEKIFWIRACDALFHQELTFNVSLSVSMSRLGAVG